MKNWLVAGFLLGGFVNASSLDRCSLNMSFQTKRLVKRELIALINRCLEKNKLTFRVTEDDNTFVSMVEAAIARVEAAIPRKRRALFIEFEDIVLAQLLIFLLNKED